MKVTLGSPQMLGNKSYKKGTQEMPGHLVGNQKFKQLVKSGVITIHAKDAGAQNVQVQKDAQNKEKAEKARILTKKIEAARSAGALSHEVAGVAKPALAAKMVAKHEAAKAKKAAEAAGAPPAPVIAAAIAASKPVQPSKKSAPQSQSQEKSS